MSRILGLDLGANSIGWSVLDTEHKQILRSGVRIFPAGLNDFDTNKEQPKNAARRDARQIRRQIYRRKMRKQLLLKLLIEYDMVPLSKRDLLTWKQNDVFPTSADFRKWIALNPYTLRSMSLHQVLSLHELGRVFYHLIQRRGFLSNRKSKGEEDGKIFSGNPTDGRIGITETRDRLVEHGTLGAFLASLDPAKERLRNRYTERQMYIDEFDAIWEHQSKHNSLLTDDQRIRIGGRVKSKDSIDGVLFHQRPLRSQKGILGKCTFEPDKPRCIKDSLLFEEFRILQTANHLEINGEKLNEEDRQKVIELFLIKDKPKFKEVRKLLKLMGPGYHSNWQDEDILPGARITASLRSVFGEKWRYLSEKEREDIWHILYTADDDDWLKDYAAQKWILDDTAINKLLKIHIKPEYGSLSRKAILNILPFLRDGYLYNQSVLLGGIRNAMGADAWDALPDKETIIDTVLSFTFRSGDGTIKDQLSDFCKLHLKMTDKQTAKLYHHSITSNEIVIQDSLGEPPIARNPLVMTVLFDLRRVVNSLIQEFGKFDRIHVELARDLKKTSDERSKIKSDIAKREKEHIEIDKELAKYDIRITHESRRKYKLFKELKQKCCPYTGKGIQIGYGGSGLNLFSGQVQIEHIVPWSRSLNGSFFNLTLSDADINRAKGKLTPFEYFHDQMGEEVWNKAKARAKDILPYDKFKAFTKKDVDDDFTSRQLNDTRYASRLAKDFLKQVCSFVYVFPGGATAELRHMWGLNSLISDDNRKDRRDHRHHAIDAITIAALNANHLHQLARWNRYQKSFEMTPVDDPWEEFRDQAQRSIDEILVSYRQTDRVVTRRKGTFKRNGRVFQSDGYAARGFLHKETIYGKRTPPGSNEQRYIVRKPVDGLTKSAQIEKIIDPVVRRVITNRLIDLGVDITARKYDVPKGAFFHTSEDGTKTPLLYMPSKSGKRIPIRKVRMEENLGNAVAVTQDQTQWVNPRNNHHIAIYQHNDGKLEEVVVTFWDAVQRKMHSGHVFQRQLDNGAQLVTTMQMNDLFLLGLPHEAVLEVLDIQTIWKCLYRVQKLSSSYYVFRLHAESTISRDEKGYFVSIQSMKAWVEHNPIKVHLDPSGKLTLAI